MSTLKTTVKLESSTLFPSPISITKAVERSIVGEYSSFQSNTLPAAGLETIFENEGLLGDSGILYFYAEASTGNRAGYGIDILINNKSSNSSAYCVRLFPGDVAYFPIYAADASGIIVSARNNDSTESASMTYFFGAKD